MTFFSHPILFVTLALVFHIPYLVWSCVFDACVYATVDLVVGTFLFVTGAIMTSASVTFAVSRHGIRGRLSTVESLGTVLALKPGIFSTACLGGLLVAVGLLFMFVPGVFAALWIVFLGPVLLQSDHRLMDAVKKSASMIGEGRWIPILLFAVLCGLLKLLFDLVPSAGFHFYYGVTDRMQSLQPPQSAHAFQSVAMRAWTALVDTGLLALFCVWTSVLWFDLTDERSQFSPVPPARS